MNAKEHMRRILSCAARLELRAHRGVQEAMIGGHFSLLRGRGMEFDDVREYVPGDPTRSIDWNVTARAGRPYVKNFTEEREMTVQLLIDMSASGDFGAGELSKRELTAEIAAVIALGAMRNHDRVGAILFTDRVEHHVPPGRGRGHVLRIVRDLLAFQPSGAETDFNAALDHLGRTSRRRSLAVLITDFCLPGNHDEALARFAKALRISAMRHDLVALWLFDPVDRQLPDLGRLTIEDAETGEQVSLDSGRPAVRDAYAAETERRRQGVLDCLKRSTVPVLELDTSLDYLPLLVSFLARRHSPRRAAS